MINDLINIAQQAGKMVSAIYAKGSFETTLKHDQSVLTEADTASHVFICESLQKRYPDIPIISEESVKHVAYEERSLWDKFFLVDPLDGTKEFIKRNDEFTINIALVEGVKPVLGVIHAPALHMTYYAEKQLGAHKIMNGKTIKLPAQSHSKTTLHAVLSRSHGCTKNEEFLEVLRAEGKEVSILTIGSALKFGLIAEGHADIYPRFSPTMEWDTAAGQILVNEVGKMVIVSDDRELTYNKCSLVNPEFMVK